MLDRLPTELMLVIAELAAPRTAQDRQCLFINRRRWFAQLASISRSSWLALRPLIWTEIWIFEHMVSALVHAVERDPSFAPFTKRLICTAIPANALIELHRVFPRFSNVKSVEIKHSGSETAPLELTTIERLRALRHLSLEQCWTAPTLPRLDQLETLCLRSDELGIPIGQDVPLAPTRIITELSSASTRSLRLLEQYNPLSFRDPDSPRPDFANLTLLELDGMSFETVRELKDAFPSLACRIVLKCDFDDLDRALVSYLPISGLPLPPKFEIWVQSDALPESLRSIDVEDHLQALIWVAPRLSALTLPLNLGIGRESDEIAEARAHIYEFLKQFVRTKIPIHFHNAPPDTDDILYPDFKTLDEFDGQGYFSDLVEGKVDDPELRDFRIVVV